MITAHTRVPFASRPACRSRHDRRISFGSSWHQPFCARVEYDSLIPSDRLPPQIGGRTPVAHASLQTASPLFVLRIPALSEI